MPNSTYKLITLEKPYPGFTKERRIENFNENYWEQLKKKYNYRCAYCGSKENSYHRYWKNKKVKLQKDHKNPLKPLEEGNIIPQCDSCKQNG